MSAQKTYRPLTSEQIKRLQSAGCTAGDWKGVSVSEGFNAAAVVNVSFSGNIRIGGITGAVKGIYGEKPAGIYNAAISNCTIGDNVRIANIGVGIANYDIEDNVCIEDVGTMHTEPGASFGNGVEIEVLNEAGGREVVLFDRLNAQFAYIMCLHRYRPELIKKLRAVAGDYVKSVKSDRGRIAAGARVCSVPEIINLNIGSYATVNAAMALVNGTILSSKEAPTTVGSGVVAEDFIIAESSRVGSGAVLAKVFVGQGCRLGKQFSAESSLFFANCEGFHGEALSIFAGPYTVTHHKSTLLIAGLFSFYNAGSGTNQSNHMYKLGPCHEGKVLRGSKTGSFSYMMWPCRVGPFSVVLGKHSSTFDTADFPFSHHEARPDGKCAMIPGLHLTTVGTVRDGAKWPARDNRRGTVKRDMITFDVFSPYTIGRMLKGSDKLRNIYETTDKAIEEVSVGGAMVRRPILRTGMKFYRTGIEMYLLEKFVRRAETALQAGGSLDKAFAVEPGAVFSQDWVDIGGQFMPAARLEALQNDIETGKIADIDAFYAGVEKIFSLYSKDEWAWVAKNYKDVFGIDPAKASPQDVVSAAENLAKVKGKFFTLVIADAEKEFDQLSQTGFGQDGSQDDTATDFAQVRGLYEQNKFVKEMRKNVLLLQQRAETLREKLLKV